MRLLTLLLLLVTVNANAEFYKKINPDGSVSYSDSQTPGSEEITPPKLTTTPPLKFDKKAKNKTTLSDDKTLPYESFTITSPADQAVIRDNDGNASFSFASLPPLQTELNHSISIFLDGKASKTGLSALTTQLTNLDRGSHTVSAQILDKNKKVLKTSQSITVHIKRHSQLHPKSSAPN